MTSQVTLFTRGKTPIAQQIPDDTPEFFKEYSSKLKHIAGNRQEADSVKALLKDHKRVQPCASLALVARVGSSTSNSSSSSGDGGGGQAPVMYQAAHRKAPSFVQVRRGVRPERA